jgi:hypothetical protein
MDGRLEHEIRQIPGVLACSFSGEDIAVLVDPSADRAEVEARVRTLLRSRGVAGGLFVLGGVGPVRETAPGGGRKLSTAGVLAAAFTAGAALAASIALIGTSHKAPSRPPRAQPPQSPSPSPPLLPPQKPKPRLTPAEVAEAPPRPRPKRRAPRTDVVARRFARKRPMRTRPIAMPPSQQPPAPPPSQQPPAPPPSPPSTQPPAPSPAAEPAGAPRAAASSEPTESTQPADTSVKQGGGRPDHSGRSKHRGNSDSSHRFVHCDNGHARGQEHKAKHQTGPKQQRGRGHRH